MVLPLLTAIRIAADFYSFAAWRPAYQEMSFLLA